MTDIELAALLADARRAGTCHVQAHERTAMIEAATTLDFAIITLDLAPVQDKSTLLDAIATALEFPHDFGHNWDALADSLGDLSWRPAPGYMLLLEHADALREIAPRDFTTLLEILDEARRSHARADVPFWILLASAATDESCQKAPAPSQDPP